jgi:hypothetical protein
MCFRYDGRNVGVWSTWMDPAAPTEDPAPVSKLYLQTTRMSAHFSINVNPRWLSERSNAPVLLRPKIETRVLCNIIPRHPHSRPCHSTRKKGRQAGPNHLCVVHLGSSRTSYSLTYRRQTREGDRTPHRLKMATQSKKGFEPTPSRDADTPARCYAAMVTDGPCKNSC